MKITEINIKSFGKLHDRSLTLDDGMNVVRGDNESGKSTLLAFIKFVLYGVGRKNPNVPVGERERAASWSDGTASGSLTVEDTDGKRYRIERTGREGARGAFVDKVRIIDLSCGQEVFSGENPGEHFLGIGAFAYDSTCSIRQLECVALNGTALREVIDNLLSSGDENTSVQSAVKLLDKERKRLLHVSGRGGLLYEAQRDLDRLRSEYRSALIFENELNKNRSELEEVELSIDKATEEHRLAQKMCDLHDDVIRLEKFDTLRELCRREKEEEGKQSELDLSLGFDASLASYSDLAELKRAREALENSSAALRAAREERDSAQAAFDSVKSEDESDIAELLAEYGSARGVIMQMQKKRKKKSNSFLLSVLLGISGALLLALALVALAFLDNFSGALTLAFLGAIPAALAVGFYKKYGEARAELEGICSRAGVDVGETDDARLLDTLVDYDEHSALRSRRSNALNAAQFRLSVTEEGWENDRLSALSVISHFGTADAQTDAEIIESISALEGKIESYLGAKRSATDTLTDIRARIKGLRDELSRFDESVIRSKITPELEEKIKNIPFERLRADRESALNRVNQLSRYRTGIQNNLSMSQHRRSPDEIFCELEAEEENVRRLTLRLEAVRLATETVEKASETLKSGITPRISQGAQEYLREITNGKYGELFVDGDMGLSYFDGGETRNIASLSRGSLDVAYFALRLSLIDTLIGDKMPPLYMDECLSQLDDGRARALIEAVGKRCAGGAQCLLLTCQTRDVRLCKEVLDKINLIEL